MQRFTLQKRLEIFSADALAEARAGKIPTDWYGLSRRIQEFTLGDLATRITMPTLAIQYELDAVRRRAGARALRPPPRPDEGPRGLHRDRGSAVPRRTDRLAVAR